MMNELLNQSSSTHSMITLKYRKVFWKETFLGGNTYLYEVELFILFHILLFCVLSDLLGNEICRFILY